VLWFCRDWAYRGGAARVSWRGRGSCGNDGSIDKYSSSPTLSRRLRWSWSAWTGRIWLRRHCADIDLRRPGPDLWILSDVHHPREFPGTGADHLADRADDAISHTLKLANRFGNSRDDCRRPSLDSGYAVRSFATWRVALLVALHRLLLSPDGCGPEAMGRRITADVLAKSLSARRFAQARSNLTILIRERHARRPSGRHLHRHRRDPKGGIHCRRPRPVVKNATAALPDSQDATLNVSKREKLDPALVDLAATSFDLSNSPARVMISRSASANAISGVAGGRPRRSDLQADSPYIPRRTA